MIIKGESMCQNLRVPRIRGLNGLRLTECLNGDSESGSYDHGIMVIPADVRFSAGRDD